MIVVARPNNLEIIQYSVLDCPKSMYIYVCIAESNEEKKRRVREKMHMYNKLHSGTYWLLLGRTSSPLRSDRNIGLLTVSPLSALLSSNPVGVAIPTSTDKSCWPDAPPPPFMHHGHYLVAKNALPATGLLNPEETPLLLALRAWSVRLAVAFENNAKRCRLPLARAWNPSPFPVVLGGGSSLVLLLSR